jgi:diacylglycerol kinase family enzyme
MWMSAESQARVAVILNARARGVRPRVVERLEQLVPANDLFVSRDLQHSRQIARTVVERAYDNVLFGGGDGTFVQCLSDIAGEAERRALPVPGVGVLRLGTGNALADALGASRPTVDGLRRDLDRAARRGAARALPLLAVDGKLTPFAGCGLDAQILDDFARVGAVVDRLTGPLAPRIGAGARYALTVGLRSTPRFVMKTLPAIEIINRGGPAWRVDWRTGRIVDEEPLPAGRVLFRGRAALATASTIPYFGLRMKMFPYAQACPGRFNLRLSTASAYETLRNLPAVFRGEYRTPNLIDYFCDAIEIRMERPVPVQVGGDLQDAPRDRLEVGLARSSVRVLA